MSAANADPAELAKAIHRFGEAWACGDVTVLETLLSQSYSHIDAYGAFHDRRPGRLCRAACRGTTRMPFATCNRLGKTVLHASRAGIDAART